MGFVHLTGQSNYTPLGSLCSIDKIVTTAKEYGMNAVGLTDLNNFYGVFKFYKKCKAEKIKPIVGTKLNICFLPHNIHENNTHYQINLLVKNDEGYHNLNTLITLAQTEGKESGESDAIPKVYYKDVLKRAEGLVCLSGGYEGLWNQIINVQNSISKTEWEDRLLDFKEAFKDDFYIEIQDHGVSSELEVNVELLKLHKKHNIEIVLTHNYLYNNTKQTFAYEVIKSIKKGFTVNRDLREYVFENYETLDFEKDIKFREFLKDGNQFYFKSPAEMESLNLVKFFPQLLTNIDVIVDKCNLKLHLDNPEMPNYPLPTNFDTEENYFKHLTEEGFEKRLPNILKLRNLERFPDEQETITYYRERLKYEVDMICKMGFPGYFLVVWDVCLFARNEGIYMAPGRGSVAGSLVAFCLEITGIDPIAKDLLFERFLNPARVSMPDIDLDFDSIFRSKVLDYTYKKYGQEYVAQIVAFNTLAAKPAVSDTAKALNLYDESLVASTKYNEFSDFIKKMLLPTKSIKENIASNEELKNLYDNNKTVHYLLEIAQEIENSVKTTSMHAGGVVIGKSPIAQYIPSQKAKAKKNKEDATDDLDMDMDEEDGENTMLEGIVIQADKKACEPLGLIKMDYLATAILSKIRITLSSINKKRRKLGLDEIKFYDLCEYVQYTTSKEDPKMFDILQKGNSLMIFQCENPALGNVLTQFYPETFEDVTAILALYRPGPMANIPTYIANKNNPDKIDFMHDDLKQVLSETFGIIVYQEQIMQLVQTWAGFSLAEADLIRRAIGKKEEDVLKAEGEKFVTKAVEMGRDEALSRHLYQLIVKFADYGFNKSHAAAYAVLCLVTAWLKAYHPLEYTMCFINSYSSSQQKPVEKISNYIYNLIDMGYEVLPPHVNSSDYLFTLEEDKMRHGLFSIKDSQEKSIKLLIEERERNGIYNSYHDMILRNMYIVDDADKKEGFKIESVNKATIESLLLINGLSGLCNAKKSEMISKVTDSLNYYKKAVTDKEKRKRDDQGDLFAMFGGMDDEKIAPFEFPPVEDEFTWNYLLQQELKKMRLSYHTSIQEHIAPINHILTYREDFDKLQYEYVGTEKKPYLHEHKNKLFCCGLIRAKRVLTKGVKPMAFFTFRDHTGIIETTFFGNEYEKYKTFLEEHENSLLVFKGSLQRTVYGKTNHESKVYNMNVNEVFTLDEVIRNPSLLVDAKKVLNQEYTPTVEQRQAVIQDITQINHFYNVAHIKIMNDINIKQQIKDFLVRHHNPHNDTKVILHEYERPNIKSDVIMAMRYNVSLEDIRNLIRYGIINKRNIFLSRKIEVNEELPELQEQN